jgi:hypothetical protein
MDEDCSQLPLEIRRKRFLALTAEIAKELDAKGISDGDVDRDFEDWRKRRRRKKSAGDS